MAQTAIRSCFRLCSRKYKKFAMICEADAHVASWLGKLFRRPVPIGDLPKLTGLLTEVVSELSPFLDRAILPAKLFRSNPISVVLECVRGPTAVSTVRKLEQVVLLTKLSDRFISTSLVSCYVSNDSAVDAERALLRIPLNDRRSVSWCGVIAVLARSGRDVEACNLVDQMRKSTAPINAMTAIAILKAGGDCKSTRLVLKGMEVFRAVCPADVRAAASAISALSSVGKFDLCEAIFSAIPLARQDAALCSVMMAACVDPQHSSRAYAILQHYSDRGLQPDVPFVLAGLKAAAQTGDARLAESCLQLSSKHALSAQVCVALVDAFGKCRRLDRAQQIFTEFAQRTSNTSMLFNSMIGAAGECRDSAVALQTYLSMRADNVQPDVATILMLLKCANAAVTATSSDAVASLQRLASDLAMELKCSNNIVVATAIIHSFAKAGNLIAAKQVLEAVPLQERTPSLYSALISGYSALKDAVGVNRVLDDMQAAGIRPDVVNALVLIGAAADTPSMTLGARAVKIAEELNMLKDVRIVTAMIAMYGRCGFLADAKRVFATIPPAERTVVVFAALMTGLSAHGSGDEALLLYNDMLQQGIVPNEEVLTSTVNALGHQHRGKEAKRIFDDAVAKHKLLATNETLAVVAGALARSGELADAENLLSQIQPASVFTLRVLLGACRTYSDVERAGRVFQKLIALAPNDASAYVLLANTYAATGRFADSERMHARIKELGLKKTPGMSWHETGGVVHAFYAHHSQPTAQWEAICTQMKEFQHRLLSSGYSADLS